MPPWTCTIYWTLKWYMASLEVKIEHQRIVLQSHWTMYLQYEHHLHMIVYAIGIM